MRMSAIMILIEKKKDNQDISLAELQIALEMERKMVIDAFNACAMEEVLNNKHYLNGMDYYEKTYNALDD
jgi:hypothetical protein